MGDDTYPVEYGRQMMQEVLEKKTDMVVGDRLSSTYFEENKRPFHNFGNSLVRFSINHLFKSDIRDIMTGYRAFSFQFVKTFPVLSKGFEIETEMSIHAVDKNMQISNIIIEYRDRPEGSESKLNTYSDGFKVLKTIGRLYKNYKPMNFFWNFIIAFNYYSSNFICTNFCYICSDRTCTKISYANSIRFYCLGCITEFFLWNDIGYFCTEKQTGI